MASTLTFLDIRQTNRYIDCRYSLNMIDVQTQELTFNRSKIKDNHIESYRYSFSYIYIIMIRQDIIKNLSNSLNYFSTLSPEKVEPKSFQQNVTFIQTFLSNNEIRSSCPKQFLDNIFTILVSKYYQLYSQNISIISQQYLQNKYVALIKTLYQQFMDKEKLQKNIYALCLSANINKLKQEITSCNLKNNQTVITLFKFNLSLLTQIACRNDYKIIQYYPRCMSLLSNSLRKENVSLKLFELILETMKLLIQNNQYFYEGSRNQTRQNNVKFQHQSLKRLTEDVDYLINTYHKLQTNFKFKLKPFSEFLISFYNPTNSNYEQELNQLQSIFNSNNKNQICTSLQKRLFSSIILLAQMNELSIPLQQYQFLQVQTIKQSFEQLFITTCRQAIKVQVNIEQKKHQLNKLIYLLPFVYITEEEPDQVSHIFHQFINHIFHINKNHCLISIPHHASTIPLENIQPKHSKLNYPISNLQVQYNKQFTRMLIQIIPFYELQIELVSFIRKLFQKLNQSSRFSLLRYFTDCLLQQQYQLDMSLTKLYKYLSIILAIKFIVTTSPASFKWFHLAYSIFDVLGSKSDSVKRLKASYIEQELLISATIQLIYSSYSQLKRNYMQQSNITSKIKSTQSTITLIQKILNSFSEESYLIRLATNFSILQFTHSQSLSQSLQPIQAALIHRNKNNLELMLNILSLSVLNQIDYQQLAEYYMSHKNCEIVLRKLLPKISVQTSRKCLLTVEKWWLLLTQQIIEYLNNKQMKKSDKQQEHFYIKDGENVVIKNALGVIILQLSSKWTFYLQTQKREAIVDIILKMAKINPDMVFFKSNFNNIIKELTAIINTCLGQEPETIITKKNKTQTQRKKIQIQKVDFYDRLRLKIYQIFINIPKESYVIYEKQLLTKLNAIIQARHQEVKKDYLFNGNNDLKRQYDLGKLILQKFQN